MKRIITLLIGMILILGIKAQDVHFSQFNQAPLIQNPAFAGATSPLEATINYRSQWKSITVPYKTSAASLHMRLQKSRNAKNYFGMGLNFFNDHSGDGQLVTTVVNYSLAFHVQVKKNHHLGLGLQAGYGQRKIDTQGFQWGSQYETGGFNVGLASGENYGSPAFSYLDLSGGLIWTYNNNGGRMKVQGNNLSKGSVGLSLFHFNRANYSFNATGEKLMMKYVLHGNFLQSLGGSKVAINPGFMAYRQGPNREFLIGSLVRYDLLAESKYSNKFENVGASIGAYWRMGDALVITSLIEFGAWNFGFSYDANMSTLRQASNGRGGFEISIGYNGASSQFGRSIRMK
jgi:type IX secretion system PorP/SprF family membrane protein